MPGVDPRRPSSCTKMSPLRLCEQVRPAALPRTHGVPCWRGGSRGGGGGTGAMSNLVLAREVYCPIDQVWAYHTDLTRAPEWWPNVSECLRIDGEHAPPRTGTGYIWRYNMLGRTFKGAITVREVEPPTRFTFAVEGQINAT